MLYGIAAVCWTGAAVVDARESVGAYLLFSLTGAALWTFMRTLILLAAQPTTADPTQVAVSVLWAMFVLWLVFLALGAGVFLRGGREGKEDKDDEAEQAEMRKRRQQFRETRQQKTGGYRTG